MVPLHCSHFIAVSVPGMPLVSLISWFLATLLNHYEKGQREGAKRVHVQLLERPQSENAQNKYPLCAPDVSTRPSHTPDFEIMTVTTLR